MSTKKRQFWQQRLAESRAELLAVLNMLQPVQWQSPVFSEGDTWSVSTVVAHLIESERAMSIHIHRIRKGEETVPEGFDIDRWNAGLKERIDDQHAHDLIALLQATRAKTLEVMASLKDEEWALTGRHPRRGAITVEQYYETMADHELGHARDIRQAIGVE